MSRVLLAALPADGHVRPVLPVAAELVRRGHQVIVYTGAAYRDRVVATGAEPAVMVHGTDYDPGDIARLVQERSATARPGPRQMAYDMENFFLRPVPGYVRDLEALVADFRPDVLVGDWGFQAIAVVAERKRLPLAVLGITVLTLSSRDTAPFGLGLGPSSSPVSRLRNRLLGAVLNRVLLRGPQRTFQRIRAEFGLPPVKHSFLDHTTLSANVYLQGTVPSFEYPRSDLPDTVEFVGAATQTELDDWTPPSWWPRVLEAREAGRPVVLVTQGTVATDPDDLIRPALHALADHPALVVVAAGQDVATAVPDWMQPTNAVVERFIPFPALLPHVDVMITNGGYGGVQMALAAGVPLVAAGRSEDKTEVCARVGWSGAGVDLKANRPTAEAIRAGVQRVLDDPSFRRRARVLAREYADRDSLALQTTAILRLADRRRAGRRRQTLAG